MKAIAVHPGVPNSMHLREVDRPSVADVPDGRGVLLEPLTVAEKAINQAFEVQRRLKVWRPRRWGRERSACLLTTLALRLRGLEVTCLSLPKPPYLNSELIEQLGARCPGGGAVRALRPDHRGDRIQPAHLVAEPKPWLIASAFTSVLRSPPVTLTSTSEAAEALGRNGVRRSRGSGATPRCCAS